MILNWICVGLFLLGISGVYSQNQDNDNLSSDALQAQEQNIEKTYQVFDLYRSAELNSTDIFKRFHGQYCQQMLRTIYNLPGSQEKARHSYVPVWSLILSREIYLPKGSIYRILHMIYKYAKADEPQIDGRVVGLMEIFLTPMFIISFSAFAFLNIIFLPLFGFILFHITRFLLRPFTGEIFVQFLRKLKIRLELIRRQRQHYLYPPVKNVKKVHKRFVLPGFMRKWSVESVPSELKVRPGESNMFIGDYYEGSDDESEVDLKAEYGFLEDDESKQSSGSEEDEFEDTLGIDDSNIFLHKYAKRDQAREINELYKRILQNYFPVRTGPGHGFNEELERANMEKAIRDMGMDPTFVIDVLLKKLRESEAQRSSSTGFSNSELAVSSPSRASVASSKGLNSSGLSTLQ